MHRFLVTAESPRERSMYPEKRSLQKTGKRCCQRQEPPPLQWVPHFASVCGTPNLSSRPLGVQGSAVHSEGLANACFAECSDDSAQLMVWAAEMWL